MITSVKITINQNILNHIWISAKYKVKTELSVVKSVTCWVTKHLLTRSRNNLLSIDVSQLLLVQSIPL